jgi:hypothetical protein
LENKLDFIKGPKGDKGYTRDKSDYIIENADESDNNHSDSNVYKSVIAKTRQIFE